MKIKFSELQALSDYSASSGFWRRGYPPLMVGPFVYIQRLLGSENFIFLFYYSLQHSRELWGPQISVTVHLPGVH